jgi:hypothetical protein
MEFRDRESGISGKVRWNLGKGNVVQYFRDHDTASLLLLPQLYYCTIMATTFRYGNYLSMDEQFLPSQQQFHPNGHRFLQDTSRSDPRATSKDGTIAILVVVSILFCGVWFPGFCRRRCWNQNDSRRQRYQHDRESVANIVRQSLEIQRRARAGGYEQNSHIGIVMERRRAAVEAMLITKVCIKLYRIGEGVRVGVITGMSIESTRFS